MTKLNTTEDPRVPNIPTTDSRFDFSDHPIKAINIRGVPRDCITESEFKEHCVREWDSSEFEKELSQLEFEERGAPEWGEMIDRELEDFRRKLDQHEDPIDNGEKAS